MNPDGTITDKWVLDPVVILKPTGTPHKAYGYAVSNATIPISNPSAATTEFTSTEYENIASDNAVYTTRVASATTLGRYANVAKRFVFDLSPYEGITQIVYRWDGYGAVTCDLVAAKAQHKETTGWVDDVTSIPNSDGAGFEISVTLTNISSIVIGGIFEFGLILVGLFLETSGSVTLYTDCVEVEVIYTGVTDGGVGGEEAVLEGVISGTDEGVGEEQAAVASLGAVTSDEAVGEESFIGESHFFRTDEALGSEELLFPQLAPIFQDEGVGSEILEVKDVTFEVRMKILTERMNELLSFIVKIMPLMMVVAMVKAVKGLKPTPKPKVAKSLEKEIEKAAEKPRR